MLQHQRELMTPQYCRQLSRALLILEQWLLCDIACMTHIKGLILGGPLDQVVLKLLVSIAKVLEPLVVQGIHDLFRLSITATSPKTGNGTYLVEWKQRRRVRLALELEHASS